MKYDFRTYKKLLKQKNIFRNFEPVKVVFHLKCYKRYETNLPPISQNQRYTGQNPLTAENKGYELHNTFQFHQNLWVTYAAEFLLVISAMISGFTSVEDLPTSRETTE